MFSTLASSILIITTEGDSSVDLSGLWKKSLIFLSVVVSKNKELTTTDKDTIIAVSGGSKKEFLEQDVSNELEKLMEDKEVYSSKENSDMAMPIIKNEKSDKRNNAQIVYPIISNGDTIGTVILMSKDAGTKMNEVEKKVAQSAATFLASQMEI